MNHQINYYGLHREGILKEADIKFYKGNLEHGIWDPRKLNTLPEIEEEFLDLINYSIMAIIRIRLLDKLIKELLPES